MDSEKKRIYKKNETPSVLRKKAKKSEASRDNWKGKNQEKQKSIKAIKTRLEETKASRECWKTDCLKNANDLEECQAKLQRLEQELIQEKIEKASLIEQNEILKKKISNKTSVK